MPIPDSPITRTEQYLNAMATGDASGIPSAPITRTEQYLDYIAKNGGGGGSDLPAVTAEDNGDVLTVVDGEWAKAAPSGGGNILIVGETEVGQDVTLDKTWQEIHDADFAFLRSSQGDETMFATIYRIGEYDGAFYVVFALETGQRAYLASSADGYPVLEKSPK